MRAGGCTVHQALTPEAASTVKQAVTLARRRGHAQVTPLHVASAMLSSPSGLLRSACLHSHSHPLQCKALELCFNVALNRLPASSSSSPILGGPHHYPPSLSNALVAAFKRAQAHQRRGSVESQQQPLLAVKIELEQLVISILDDPSVSRVMREAGFSSTQVKANVEQAVLSSETVAPSNPNPSSIKARETTNRPTRISDELTRSEDITAVIDSLASGRRRSIIVVGECLAASEGVVKGVMDRVERCEVPEILRSLQFITLPLFSFRNLAREEVEHKVGELKCLLKGCCVGIRGAVLFLGDLRWAAEYRASGDKERRYYCPVEHVILEIRALVCGGFGGDSGRFWVMGVASYTTYNKCRAGSPSLESLLGLHPLTIPSGGLELTLNCDSESQGLLKSKRTADGPNWPLLEEGVGNQLLNCTNYSLKLETEVRGLSKVPSSNQGSMITTSLPSWLQQCKEEKLRATATNDKESSLNKHEGYSTEITLSFSSVSPSSYDHTLHPWPLGKHHWRQHHLFVPETKSKEQRPFNLCSVSPNNKPCSTSSSDTMEMEYQPKFKELNAENLKILCNALEKSVAQQKAVIPEIASTILQCRSGMMTRKERSKKKEETWMFFQGCDVEGKEKVARELARLVFGSYASLVSIALSGFSSTRSDDSGDGIRNKRSRSEESHSYLERFFEAVRENPHRVFIVEDIEQMDSYTQMGMKSAIENGRVRSCGGEEVSICDAIIILSCESFNSRSRACSPSIKQKLDSEEMQVQEAEKEMDSSVCLNLDLNLCVSDEDVEEITVDDDGLIESVDRVFFFKLPVSYL